MTPLVSIVINNFNYEKYLPEAIESALNQSYSNLEVVVVDDGSTDSSRSIIDSYGDRVVRVYKKNGGQSSAFNYGLGHARGLIVLFLDSDDILEPYALSEIVPVFDDPKAVCVRWRLGYVTEDGVDMGMTNPPLGVEVPEGNLASWIQLNGWRYLTPPTSGNAFRKSCLETFFPIPDAIKRCSDVYLFGNVGVRGELKFVDKVLGSYRQHTNNKRHFMLSRPKVLLELGAADITDQSVGAYIKSHLDPDFDYLEQWGFVGDELLRRVVYKYSRSTKDVGYVRPPINPLVQKKCWGLKKRLKWVFGISVLTLAASEKMAFWLVGLLLKKHTVLGKIRLS